MTDVNKMFNYIIYHEGCPDGFSGYFIATLSNRLTSDVIVAGSSPHNTRPPNNIKGADIIIIDVAFSRDVLETIIKEAKSVVFIDHHISIKNDVQALYEKYNKSDNIKIIYNESCCASLLAWHYFFGDKKMPIFLKYINDNDIGEWKYPKTKPFMMAFNIYYRKDTKRNNIENWHTLLDKKRVSKLVKIGQYMSIYNEHIISINVEKHTLKKFPSQKVYDMSPENFNKLGQYTVAVFCGHNCPSVTEIGNEALKRFQHLDFCMLWVYNLDKKQYIISMRSKKVDVQKIAKIFGFGGHKGAAAFSIYSNKLTIDDLFYYKNENKNI